MDVELSARGSFDPDDEALLYDWDFGDGSGKSTNTSTEVAHTFELPGTYVTVVTVSDPTGLIGAAEIKLQIIEDNAPPTAKANFYEVGAYCTFWTQVYGDKSEDPEGDPLTFKWRFVDLPVGSSAEFNNPSVMNPSFYPDVIGSYTLSLTVNDGNSDSAPSELTIECSSPL